METAFGTKILNRKDNSVGLLIKGLDIYGANIQEILEKTKEDIDQIFIHNPKEWLGKF